MSHFLRFCYKILLNSATAADRNKNTSGKFSQAFSHPRKALILPDQGHDIEEMRPHESAYNKKSEWSHYHPKGQPLFLDPILDLSFKGR